MFKKNRKVPYPDYLLRLVKKRRCYDNPQEVRELYYEKYQEYPSKDHQRHHINTNKGSGNTDNIIYLHKDTHKALHAQLDVYMFWFIELGILKFDEDNPHYYIEDPTIKALFQGKIDLLNCIDDIIFLI
ncbi:hypothetical protein [Cognatishimia sp.]|uniref:hypothetical protein n=1 Tax=Cognatishimia sp. TaxID=2211648 RepID=UPI003511D6AA|nr:hypothetical protein [Cognatishimia sp.]